MYYSEEINLMNIRLQDDIDKILHVLVETELLGVDQHQEKICLHIFRIGVRETIIHPDQFLQIINNVDTDDIFEKSLFFF
jgi:hypothetical protein